MTPLRSAIAVASLLFGAQVASAQTPPSAGEIAAYTGLFAAAQKGDTEAIERLIKGGGNPNARDGHGRTPLHVAAHRGDKLAAKHLVGGGADPRAQDSRRYDIITIAAVRDDPSFVQWAINLGADPKAVTSPYDGTALIAAAHLGFDGVVDALIKAGSPIDHVNNLGWTALIEAIVLGDGGKRHTRCVELLLAAKANPNLADRNGASPLALAKGRGYAEMARLITAAGGK
jgi:uncharacterized protein